jgi:hypothetical protein
MSTMLEAALSYGSDGIPVFPCNADKKPLTKNGFKDATVDCNQITQWWTKWPDAMIGMPTGPLTGVSVLDIDRKNGKNGFNFVPNWEQLTSIRARTQNGGEHCYFKDDDSVRCTSDQIALGIDTRGRGGYVILPPSAGYAWVNGRDFSNLPKWPEHLKPPERGTKKPPVGDAETILMELPEGIPEGTGLGISDDPNDNLTIEPGLVAAALCAIPNDDLGWDDWNRIGMATWAATDGSAEGLTAFDSFSRKSKKYNAVKTTERWQHYRRSPPKRIGVGTLIWEASQAEPGWREDLRKANEQHGTDNTEQQKSEEQPKTNANDSQQQESAEQPKTDTGNTRANSERDNPQYRYGALLVRASDVVIRPKDWLWEGHLLRSSLELLTGIPGLGKSQLQCSLIASATTGKPWPNGAVGIAPVHVIMVTAEDAIDQEVVPRLIAAGADLDRVPYLEGDQGRLSEAAILARRGPRQDRPEHRRNRAAPRRHRRPDHDGPDHRLHGRQDRRPQGDRGSVAARAAEGLRGAGQHRGLRRDAPGEKPRQAGDRPLHRVPGFHRRGADRPRLLRGGSRRRGNWRQDVDRAHAVY